MPGPIPFREFRRKMSVLHVDIKQGGKATHLILTKNAGGHKLVYVIAKHGNEVKKCYIDATKKALQISDEDFDKA
jgi:hypothetical protein